MGWLVGWCHSHGGLDSQGCRPALVPAGFGIRYPASVGGSGSMKMDIRKAERERGSD